MNELRRPSPEELPDYFRAYLAAVPDGDVLARLEEQRESTARLLAGVPEERGDHRYAPGKWSVKEIVGHLADTERVFAYRALSFARGDATPLPGFEQDDWVAVAGFDARPLAELAAELRRVRDASLALFRSFDAAAWGRRGVASGFEIPVVAFPWITVGHELHHLKIFAERYDVGT